MTSITHTFFPHIIIMASVSSPSDPAVITHPITCGSDPIAAPVAAPDPAAPQSSPSEPVAPTPSLPSCPPPTPTIAAPSPALAPAAAADSSPVPTVAGAICPIIKVYNQSTLVSDADVQTMVNAINQLLPTFLDAWSLQSCVAQFCSGSPSLDNDNWTFVMLDETGVDGALAYHTEEINDIVDGFIGCKDILNAPGVTLYQDENTVTIASALSHEIFETLVDPQCNRWADDGQGTLWSLEVADPVQGNFVIITEGKQEVGLSDFVLPAFFDPANTTGPWNFNNDLTGPFQVDVGGYAVIQPSGAVQQILGMHAPVQLLGKKSKNKFSRFGQRRGVPRFQPKGVAKKQKAKPMKR